MKPNSNIFFHASSFSLLTSCFLPRPLQPKILKICDYVGLNLSKAELCRTDQIRNRRLRSNLRHRPRNGKLSPLRQKRLRLLRENVGELRG